MHTCSRQSDSVEKPKDCEFVEMYSALSNYPILFIRGILIRPFQRPYALLVTSGGSYIMAEIRGARVIENPHADDLFADDAAAFALVNGVVRTTFTSFRTIEPGGESAHVIVGHVAMPLKTCQAFVMGLYNFLKERGHDPMELLKRSSDDAKH